jgi:Ca2+-binding RTX toxin-like protein
MTGFASIHGSDGAEAFDTTAFGSSNDTIGAGGGDDSIASGAGQDRIDAGAGNDLVFAGNGHDRLFGGTGDDTLAGEGGPDTLIGGAGDDSLAGGQGEDAFVFESNFGDDIITGFNLARDTLEIQENINGLAIDSPADLAPFVTEIGGNAVIAFPNGDSITLQGVSRDNLLDNLDDVVSIV